MNNHADEMKRIVERLKAKGLWPRNKSAPATQACRGEDNRSENAEIAQDTLPQALPTSNADVQFRNITSP